MSYGSRMNGGGAQQPHASSAARRKLLMENDVDDKVPIVSNLFQLDIYLNASDKLYDSFEVFRTQNELDGAYIYGKRYVKFCIEQMTKHDYFNRGKYKARCMECLKRSDHVLEKLEDVVTKMDNEEDRKERLRQERIKQQQEERLRRQREIEQKQIEELQKRVEAQKKKSVTSPTTSISSNIDNASDMDEAVETSAMAKLHLLTNRPVPAAAVEPPTKTKHSVRWNLPSVEPDGDHLPPPLLPPSNEGDSTESGTTPPSYTSVVQQSSFFGPGKGPTSGDGSKTAAQSPSLPAAAPAYDQVVAASKKAYEPPPQRPKIVPIRKFVADMKERHAQYQREGKIQIWPLKTYQGRTSGSTNGCTVISACVVSKHMETRRGVDDDQVQSVIDRECVPLLRSIRNKLDLGAASLIIPSDVHDYLVDKKLLYQHKFAGAAGGNIVDPQHSGELLNLLRGEPGKTAHLKAAATLFFREHVVSIVKFPQGQNGEDAIYDMIDSLPTLNGRGSRTRCHSLEAFRVHLAKYCTQKLSDANLKYIEKNPWDDSMADFDPRVFQAFVWMDFGKSDARQ